MSEEDWKLILEKSNIVVFKKGCFVLDYGARNENFYKIKSGQAVVSLNGNILQKLSEGDIFGDMSLLGENTSSASVVCASECEIYVIENKVIWKILDLRKDIGCKLFKGLAFELSRRLRNADSKYVSNKTGFNTPRSLNSLCPFKRTAPTHHEKLPKDSKLKPSNVFQYNCLLKKHDGTLFLTLDQLIFCYKVKKKKKLFLLFFSF